MPVTPTPSPTDLETLKLLVPLAVPAIKTAIDNWLSPAIAKIAKTKGLIKNSKPEQVEKAFADYLLRAYSKLSYMNTIVFGNQQKRIQDLYIPLTVRSTGPNEKKSGSTCGKRILYLHISVLSLQIQQGWGNLLF